MIMFKKKRTFFAFYFLRFMFQTNRKARFSHEKRAKTEDFLS